MAGKSDTPDANQSIGDRLAIQGRRDQASLAQSGAAKLGRGESPTAKERAAIVAWEKEQLAKWGAQYVAGTPKGLYCDSVGIAPKVAIEQSRRFELPYHTSGKTVDLFAILAAWHQWASKHKHGITRLIRSEQVQDLLEDDVGLDFWQCELVKERTLKERDARQQREGTMLPRQLFHDLLQEFYIEPMRRRIEQCDREETEGFSRLADSLRDDVSSFESAIEIIFTEHDEDSLSTTDKPSS